MRSFLCAKLSLAMFLDTICLQSTLSIPLSLSVSLIFPSFFSLALEENKSPDCLPGKGSEDTLSLLGWVRVQTSCTLPTHTVEWRRPFARHQEQTPPSPCGSLWHCSVEMLGSFQTLWEHRSGLLDWPLLTRVQSPALWGFPFSGLWLPWRSLYGDCLACAHHCVRQSRARESQAQPREPTRLSLLTSGPYSVPLLSTVQALLHIRSITVCLFLRRCGKKDVYSSQMGFSGPRKVFCWVYLVNQ